MSSRAVHCWARESAKHRKTSFRVADQLTNEGRRALSVRKASLPSGLFSRRTPSLAPYIHNLHETTVRRSVTPFANRKLTLPSERGSVGSNSYHRWVQHGLYRWHRRQRSAASSTKKFRCECSRGAVGRR